METAIKQLQQIKGIGEVLAKRLAEAGFDTPARLAAASTKELAGIKGLLPTAIPGIQAQAQQLSTTEADETDEKSLADMLDDTERLRTGVANLVIRLRDQQAQSDDGKAQRQLRKEITRVLATLERVEASLAEQLRKLGKKLAKADARLAEVGQSDLEALTKGLRQTRKAIDKIVRD